MIFLMTLYLQKVLGFSALTTGLIFGVPSLAAVAAGVIAGRFIGRFGTRKVLTVGMAVQGLATVPLVFLGTDGSALAILIPALFIGFFAHVTSIVAYTVTGTSGLPDQEQGLATGLTSMTQQVATHRRHPDPGRGRRDAERGADRHPPRAERERRRDARQRGPRLARPSSARPAPASIAR